MKSILTILALFITFGMQTVCAQQMTAKQMPFFYELSSNEIFEVYQDKEGYIWIGTTHGLERYDGYRLQSFKSDYSTPNLLTDNSIISLSDNQRYLWIGTKNGLNLFDKQTCRMAPFPEKVLQKKEIGCVKVDRNEISWVAAEGKVYKCSADAIILKEYIIEKQPSISMIYEDREGTIWVLSRNGLFRYNPATDSFLSYPPFGKKNDPFTMYQDKSGNYWIGTWGEGLWQFFPDKSGQQCYVNHPIISTKDGSPEPIFFSITQDDTYGYLWMLSYNELYALKQNTLGKLEKVDIRNLVDTHKMYTKIVKDRNGNLWLGSYDMAYTLFFDEENIDNYPLPQLKQQMGWDTNILGLCLDKENIMWVNQDRYGLCLYDISKDRLTITNDVITMEISTIERSLYQKGVWVGRRSFPHIMRLEHQDMKINIKEHYDLSKLMDKPGNIKQVLEDLKGNLWILTSAHLLMKPAGERTFIITDKNIPFLSCLTMDEQGEIWGVSSERDVYRLNFSEHCVVNEHYATISTPSQQETINNMCVDQEGSLWVVSSWGTIYKSNKEKQDFRHITFDNAIQNSSILNLVADQDYVWIITNKKTIRYNIHQQTLANYSTTDGNIQVNVFRNRAMVTDGKGGLYVGGHGGFIHIHAKDSITAAKEIPHLTVTDVKVESKSILFPIPISPGRQHNRNDHIYLHPDDRNIEIFFSSLQYSLNSKVRFAYKLEGVDKDWVFLESNKHSVFYNRLGKGTYQFQLKYEYEQGKWTDGKVLLIIEKQPAFYETWYAYLGYAILIGVCTLLILRVYLQRIKKKNEIRFKEELTQTKLDYFTNVSHELLTPLTVISCTIDYLEAKTPSMREKLGILSSNTNRLKRLIQQVLDFRKMDMGKMMLSVSWGNVSEFISTICRSNFSPLAQQKNITLQVSSCPDDIWGYLDLDKLDKIVYNLLSNAIKYTPGNKQIQVRLQAICKEGHNFLLLEVEDEGVGIPKKELSQIFTRFYTNRKNKGIESNGIGLSLTRELIALHRGEIHVQSTPGKGTCFTVEIPIDKENYTADEFAEIRIQMEINQIHSEESIVEEINKPTLLLVDDNVELLYLMKETMENMYHVVTAENGQHAWEKLRSYAIDIAICDVMMPDMNGWELCHRMKADIRFNHIPVIILTAKNSMDDRVASYEAGADGYIAKPFELKVLSARIDNLIKSYKVRQTAFRQEQNISLESMTHQSADKQFLQSVIASIEQHLEEPEFDLEQLAAEVNMSKSTLHRKIKSITGLTPLDFVRNIKMKRACMMLVARQQTIAEVAYATGFNNPKYFTKCFKEEFGITPTEYQQTNN